jgi:hypothetical protein
MSTLSISPSFISGIAATPRLARNSAVRLTQRGRVVIVLAALVAALIVMLALSGWATASLDKGAPVPTRTVEVQPGDTLYGIARTVSASGDIRAMVHQIMELNSLPDANLIAGEKLAVPISK